MHGHYNSSVSVSILEMRNLVHLYIFVGQLLVQTIVKFSAK